MFHILQRFRWGILLALLVTATAAAAMIWQLQQPLYNVGAVKSQHNLRAPLQPPEQTSDRYWNVEAGVQLRRRAYGNGAPVLVIHGGPAIPFTSNWRGLALLEDQYRFHFYDQRGCGESSRPFQKSDKGYYANMIELERTLGLGAQIADIERIRRQLDVDQLRLVGHSFGGFIAALYAAEFPDRVRSLVLVAPAGMLTPPEGDRDLFAQARNRLAPPEQARFDRLIDTYLDFGHLFERTDEQLAKLHEEVGGLLIQAMGYADDDLQSGQAGGWSAFAMFFSCGRAQDYRPALSYIRAPTLIVHGADDTMSLAGSRSYESIPGSRWQLITTDQPEQIAGHFIYDDCPQQFADIVGPFLQQ